MEIRDDPVIWREKGGTGIMALFEIDESSGLPVWVQLRNRFVYLIKTGHYQPGDQLPSVRTPRPPSTTTPSARCT